MVTNLGKKQLINKSFNLFNTILDEKEYKSLKTKFNNINGKTGQYNVPLELFQQRTHKSNRVLIEWKTVMRNKLTIDDLSLFEGDVVVGFVNNDYFDEVNLEFKDLFKELKSRLGSDQSVSSMILIKSEGGNPSSKVQRIAYKKLINEFPDYENHLIVRNEKAKLSGRSKGNDRFSGFIYFDIRGGLQDRTSSHNHLDAPNLFNPAVEYSSKSVCLDIDLTLHYYALKSISVEDRDSTYNDLIKDYEFALSEIIYPSISENENYNSLLDYCDDHPSLKIDSSRKNRHLHDPIQFEKIFLKDFSVKIKSDIKNIDLSHNEPVNFEKFYIDQKNNEILSASRPTNLFWSRHLSNMMQQNSTLTEYFERQEELVEKRNQILGIKKNNF